MPGSISRDDDRRLHSCYSQNSPEGQFGPKIQVDDVFHQFLDKHTPMQFPALLAKALKGQTSSQSFWIMDVIVTSRIGWHVQYHSGELLLNFFDRISEYNCLSIPYDGCILDTDGIYYFLQNLGFYRDNRLLTQNLRDTVGQMRM